MRLDPNPSYSTQILITLAHSQIRSQLALGEWLEIGTSEAGRDLRWYPTILIASTAACNGPWGDTFYFPVALCCGHYECHILDGFSL